MAQFIKGSNAHGEDHLLNATQIVDFFVKRGGASSENFDHNDDETYRYYLVAEMSSGRVHDLSSWETMEEAASARTELLNQLDGGFQLLTVDHPAAGVRHMSSVSIELQYAVQRVENAVELAAVDTSEPPRATSMGGRASWG